MKRPEKIPFTTTLQNSEWAYVRGLEKYCDYLEATLEKVIEETNYIGEK